jgi:protein-arginine kinase activator protein McsA
LGFHGIAKLKYALKRPRNLNQECPFCHTKSEAALASGLAGCPLCYEAFPEVWKKLGIGPKP